MTNNSEKESEPKGFAGFESLVSNVDKDIANAKTAESGIAPQESVPRTQAPNQAASSEKSKSEPSAWQSTASKTNSGSPKKWWWAFGVAVFFVLVVGTQGNKQSTDATLQSAAQPSVPSNSGTDNGSASIWDGLTTSAWSEENPPPGVDRVLTYAQIRYCVAEDIRLKALEGLVNQSADIEVKGFNFYVSDYNSRCGQYRYRKGSLESVRRDAESHRAEFVEAGRARVLIWRTKTDVSPSLFVPAESNSSSPAKGLKLENSSDKSEQRKSTPVSLPPPENETQIIEQPVVAPSTASKSALDTSKPDLSRVSVSERAAIERSCNSTRQYLGPKDYYNCLNRELSKLGSYNGKPDLSGISASESAAIERACNSTRQYMGPGDYYGCLTRELSKLGSHAGKPDISGASHLEQVAIERACETTRQYMGPGDYYGCLTRELAKLGSHAGKPDISGASRLEQVAIEKACNTTRQYMGPGDYYNCIERELNKLSSFSGKPDISRASVSEQSAIERSCQTTRDYMGPGDYYACLAREMLQLGYR